MSDFAVEIAKAVLQLKEFYHKSASMVEYFLRKGIFFAVDPEIRKAWITYMLPY